MAKVTLEKNSTAQRELFNLNNDVPGATLLEERAAFSYEVTGTSAAMLTQYAWDRRRAAI